MPINGHDFSPARVLRRQFLQAGGVAVGGLAAGSRSLEGASAVTATLNAPAKRAIVIFLQGDARNSIPGI